MVAKPILLQRTRTIVVIGSQSVAGLQLFRCRMSATEAILLHWCGREDTVPPGIHERTKTMFALIIPLTGLPGFSPEHPIALPPGGVPTPPIYYPPTVGGGPIYPPPVDPGYGRPGPPYPPHVGGGPVYPGRPVDPGYGRPGPPYPPHVGGGPIYPGGPVDPGYGVPVPPTIGGGPIYPPPVDPGYGRPGPPYPPHVGGGPVYPGRPVDPGYGISEGTPANPIVLPPEATLPPGTPSAPIMGGWTIAFIPGTGWVLVPPPQGAGGNHPPEPQPKPSV